jgi:hypothetical protein
VDAFVATYSASVLKGRGFSRAISANHSMGTLVPEEMRVGRIPAA